MRKTVKIKSPDLDDTIKGFVGTNGVMDIGMNTSNMDLDEIPDGISKLRSETAVRDQTINQLLETMTNVEANNDGSYLSNFQPPPKPQMSVKQESLPSFHRESDEPIAPLKNDYMPAPEQGPQMDGRRNRSYTSADFERHSAEYSNYNRVYDANRMVHKPYYMKGGMIGGSSPTPMADGRVMEKINYMIHMLEQLEVEKTANVTEEFILYTFLGIFVIYIVDSFSRSGKYIL
jgi:hypothetical protein